MRIASLSAAALALAACGDPAPDGPPSAAYSPNAGPEAAPATVAVARAEIDELDGSGVRGTVTFREADDAVVLRIALSGLPPGEHGFHIHEGSSCGPDSTGTPGGAAGGHFNPLVTEHGAPSDSRTDRHAGDLGNVVANEEGIVAGTVVDSLLALSGPTSVIGHAVVVHAGADDLTSQPSGDAGDRIACGVVESVDPEVEATEAGP